MEVMTCPTGNYGAIFAAMNDENLIRKWIRWRENQLKREYPIKELAAESGIDPTYLSRLCGGKKGLGLKVAKKLATAFGVSEAEFLTGPPQSAMGKVFDSSHEFSFYGEVDLTPSVPLLTSIPAGDWKNWIDTYPVGQGEDRVPRPKGLKGEYVFAVRVEGDSMVPDLIPGDVLYLNPEKAFTNMHGGIGVVRCNGGYKIRNIWRRGDNYLLEPSNKAYEAEMVPVTGTTIFKIIALFREESTRF